MRSRTNRIALQTRWAWRQLDEHLFERSQEIEITLEEIDVTKREDRFHGSALFVGGLGLIVIKVWTFALFFPAYYVTTQLAFTAYLSPEPITAEQISTFVMFLIFFWFVASMPFTMFPWQAHQRLSKLFDAAKDRPPIRDAASRYRYVYPTSRGLSFTNRKPLTILYDHVRLDVDDLVAGKSYRSVNAFLLVNMFVPVMDVLYLRLLWPYIFNPLQGAFAEYDLVAKKAELSEGQRVLTIGAGSVPHHIRWKRRIGPSGHITALDNVRGVINDSWRMEWLIETIRGFFGRGRPVSTHVYADAEDLPFEDEVFDVVTAIRCYFVDLDECFRVLKPGGTIVIQHCGEVTELPQNMEEDERFERYSSGFIARKPATEAPPAHQPVADCAA